MTNSTSSPMNPCRTIDSERRQPQHADGSRGANAASSAQLISASQCTLLCSRQADQLFSTLVHKSDK